MARLKKAEIIKELTDIGIPFSKDLNYNDLYSLYKNVKEKQEAINAVYTYVPEDGEELLIDRPSVPVELVSEKTTISIGPTKIKSNKNLYEQFINGGKDFDIYIGEDVIFSTKTTSIQNVKPLDEYFEVFGKKYSYQGARIKYC